ncbi:MAG TPA: NADH-quinone oxidoreductase subunit C [Polyangia bacterium]
MDVPAIFEHLQAAHADLAAALFGQFPGPASPTDPNLAAARDAGFSVHPDALLKVAGILRDDPALAFDFLQNLTAIDWLKTGHIELVYHLFSYQHRHEVVLKTSVPREAPRVPSLAGLWNNANWLEREQYDLFGVIFEGHPDLRRLLLPDDWVGHPMRKDAREATEYRGMPTTRPSSFDLLLAFDKAGPKS